MNAKCSYESYCKSNVQAIGNALAYVRLALCIAVPATLLAAEPLHIPRTKALTMLVRLCCC